MLVTVGRCRLHSATGPDVKWQWLNKWIKGGNGACYTKVGIKGESGQLQNTESRFRFTYVEEGLNLHTFI